MQQSNNYSKVYEKKNSLQFEHEIKEKFIKNYHVLVIQNGFEKFEHKLTSHFLTYFGKLLSVEYSYLGWLILKLRPVRKKKICRMD